jgi:hypothetical protein
VAKVYHPTPVLGGKAWTRPLSPRTPTLISFSYVGITPSATYFSIKSGRIPSAEKKMIFLLGPSGEGPGFAAVVTKENNVASARITDNTRLDCILLMI